MNYLFYLSQNRTGVETNVKHIIQVIQKYFTDTHFRFMVNFNYGLYSKCSDERFLEKKYKAYFGRKMNLNSPILFTEKNQWLKLYDHKDIYSTMVDKAEAKDYIRRIIGNEHIIKTIGVYDSTSDIDISLLPRQFVIKTTHDSGCVIICKDKSKFDFSSAFAEINKSLKTNYYSHCREWPYKNVKPRIICEEFLSCLDGSQVPEHKLFCFNGLVKYDLVCMGTAHSGKRTNTFYDLDFNIIPVDSVYKRTENPIEKPAYFNEMKSIAELLSHDCPFLRVDFYCLENEFYIGELTFYHNAGFFHFNPTEYDKIFGDLLILPPKSEC